MCTTTNLSNLIRAFARQDWDAADRIAASLGEAGWQYGHHVIGAAFAISVHRRFGPDINRDEVTRFVAETRAKYEDADKMPALEMEGLIRAALGEHELVDDISAEVALNAEMFILGQLLQDQPLTGDELDEFIAEVEEMAAGHM